MYPIFNISTEELIKIHEGKEKTLLDKYYESLGYTVILHSSGSITISPDNY